jgi:hypothetical protein
MTRDEFIEVLKENDYSYHIEGDKIVVTEEGVVYLGSLTSIPPGVVFNNKGDVYLRSLTSLPPGVEFNNGGDVNLSALTSIPSGVVFKNGAHVNLGSLIGVWLHLWKGNIEGIDSKRSMNKMIKDRVFER